MSRLQIQAQVVDIRSDTPHASDRFLADTNVWFWFSYPRNPERPNYQIKYYPQYIMKALSVNATLYCSLVSFYELAHVIEKAELSIYNQSRSEEIKLKQFRRLPHERKNVVEIIESSWIQISQISTPLPELSISNDLIVQSLERMKNQHLDGYDLLMIQSLKDTDIECVITDDSDYVSVPGIVVFTANRNVIEEAAQQGKLTVRPRL